MPQALPGLIYCVLQLGFRGCEWRDDGGVRAWLCAACGCGMGRSVPTSENPERHGLRALLRACRLAEDQHELWEKIFQLFFKSLAVPSDEVVAVAKAGLRVCRHAPPRSRLLPAKP